MFWNIDLCVGILTCVLDYLFECWKIFLYFQRLGCVLDFLICVLDYSFESWSIFLYFQIFIFVLEY